MDWVTGLDADDADNLPEWHKHALAIGEEPQSGNYVLVPTTGSHLGQVFHFEHDGLEFDHHADHLTAYIDALLHPTLEQLNRMATHLCFQDPQQRAWHVEGLHDNRGLLLLLED